MTAQETEILRNLGARSEPPSLRKAVPESIVYFEGFLTVLALEEKGLVSLDDDPFLDSPTVSLTDRGTRKVEALTN